MERTERQIAEDDEGLLRSKISQLDDPELTAIMRRVLDRRRPVLAGCAPKDPICAAPNCECERPA